MNKEQAIKERDRYQEMMDDLIDEKKRAHLRGCIVECSELILQKEEQLKESGPRTLNRRAELIGELLASAKDRVEMVLQLEELNR